MIWPASPAMAWLNILASSLLLSFASGQDESILSLCGSGADDSGGAAESRPSQSDWELRVETSSLSSSALVAPFGAEGLPPPSSSLSLWCTLELTVCPACLVQVSWPSSPPSLADADLCKADSGPPSAVCADLILEDPSVPQAPHILPRPHASRSLLRRPSPTQPTTFNSTGSKLILHFKLRSGADLPRPKDSFRPALEKLFPLQLRVLDNTLVRTGTSDKGDLVSVARSGGYIESPRFPDSYPAGIEKNYTLVNEEEGGKVRLVFSDFHIHQGSWLKVVDSDGSEVSPLWPRRRSQWQRPWSVESSGRSLTVLFGAAEYSTRPGFRAEYRFVGGGPWRERAGRRACDSFSDALGGELSLRSAGLPSGAYVDCVWVLAKRPFAAPLFNYLFVMVENLTMESNSEGLQLEIHEGLTSQGQRLFREWSPLSAAQIAQRQPLDGFIVDLRRNDVEETGFYLRLRGYLASAQGLSVSFAQFYKWANAECHDGREELHCANSRCVRRAFRCDGADHCGDGSDERACHGEDVQGDQPRHRLPGRHDHLPSGPSGLTTTVVLVGGLIGLTLLILVLTLVVARLYRQRLLHRLAQHSAALSLPPDDEAPPTAHRIGDRRFFVLPDPDPSTSPFQMLEAPPSYDEALKHPAALPSAADPPRPASPPDAVYLNQAFEQRAGPSEQRSLSSLSASSSPPGSPGQPRPLSSPSLARSRSSSETCDGEGLRPERESAERRASEASTSSPPPLPATSPPPDSTSDPASPSPCPSQAESRV